MSVLKALPEVENADRFLYRQRKLIGSSRDKRKLIGSSRDRER